MDFLIAPEMFTLLRPGRAHSVIDRPNQIIFMSKTASREIRLASRPKGIPTAANFALARTELEPPAPSGMWLGNLRNCAGAVSSGQPVRRKR